MVVDIHRAMQSAYAIVQWYTRPPHANAIQTSSCMFSVRIVHALSAFTAHMWVASVTFVSVHAPQTCKSDWHTESTCSRDGPHACRVCCHIEHHQQQHNVCACLSLHKGILASSTEAAPKDTHQGSITSPFSRASSLHSDRCSPENAEPP